jgi:hypothetical protein
MSRARDTAGIIQYNKISIDSNNAVGIGSSIPDTKLDVNGGVRVTGIITASSFEGDGSALTGIDASSLKDGSDIKAQAFGGGIIITGIATCDGLDLGDSERIRLGGAQDLLIYHDSSGHSYIQESGGGDLIIDSSLLNVRNAAGDETLAKFAQNGAVELYHDNSKKLETVGAGISISGNTETRDLVSVKSTDGTPGRVDLYCEVSNAHYARLVAPAHSEFSGNVTATLPTKSGDIIVGNTGSVQIADDINTTGIITATSFTGSGANLTDVSNFDWRDGSLFS